MGSFQRVNPLGDGFIRGPARILVAPVTSLYPTNLGQIIQLASTGLAPAVETLTMTGTPTGGTFFLAFQSQVTSNLAFSATAAAVQAALNALQGIAGVGGVTCTGGPFPATPIVVTFVQQGIQPLLLAGNAGLTGGTSPAVTAVMTTPGLGLYDPIGSWVEMGSTKDGVNVTRNNTETQIDVDQIQAALTALPDEWEMTAATKFAETSLEVLQNVWEGGAINVDATQTPNERHLGLGNPTSYVQRRLAILHMKTVGTSAGKIRAHVARIVTRSPQNSELSYNKTGPQSTVAHTFRFFADPTVTDPNFRFGDVVDQQPF